MSIELINWREAAEHAHSRCGAELALASPMQIHAVESAVAIPAVPAVHAH